MSSESDFDHSSSSQRNQSNRHSRSRSREKARKNKKHDWDNQSQNKRRKTVIKIPELSGFLVNFSAFMNNQAERIDSQKLKKAYDKYKKDWQNKQNELFLIEHKNDAWFLEKYDPEIKQSIEKQRNTYIHSIAAKFIEDYKKGYYDSINLSISQASLLGLQSNEREDQQQNISNNNSLDIILNNNINIYQAPYFGFNIDANTLFIKSLPKHISRNDIKQEAKKIPGFVSITVSQPVKKLNFIRYCWITYDTQQNFNRAHIALSGLCIKDTPISINKSTSKLKKIKIVKFYPKNRVDIDCQTTYNLIKTLDRQEGITENDLIKNFKISKTQLDLNILYLRRVHAYDYFSAKHYSDQRILANKIGLAHLRIETQYEQQYDISNTFKKNQQQAEKRSAQSRGPIDHLKGLKDAILKLNGDQPEVVLQKTAFKCNSCLKKFLSAEFLSKHLISKHTDLKKKIIDKLLQENYLNDPLRITAYNSNYSKEDNSHNKQNEQKNYYRKKPNQNFRNKRRQNYQDLDDPTNGKQSQGRARTLVNFLDI